MKHERILIFNPMQFNITHHPSRCVYASVCVSACVLTCVCVCVCVLISRTPFKAEWRLSLNLFCCSLIDIPYISTISPHPCVSLFQSSVCFFLLLFLSSSSLFLILGQRETLGSSAQLSRVLFDFWFSSSSLQQLLTHMFICFLQIYFYL